MMTLVDCDNNYAYLMWYLQQPIKKYKDTLKKEESKKNTNRGKRADLSFNI